MIIWAIIPVKPLRYSKSRLAHILSTDERAELTGKILKRTLAILNDAPLISRTLVVSRDTAALKVARQVGASTYRETDKQDLNMALTRAAHIAAVQKADGILVLPADLPFITSLDIEKLVEAAGPDHKNGSNGYSYRQRLMVVCSDHNHDGTNALLLSPPTGFNFQYGPGSFEKHLVEAENLGMKSTIISRPTIGFDLDTEEDWRVYLAEQSDSVPLETAGKSI
jgi:2-phospho-L-lactate guanylyltransferase